MSSEALASRAQAYIAAMPPAISGQHGHDTTFAVAKKLIHDFGMSEAEAWPIFLDYNARCQPPWNEDELRHKLKGAGNLTRSKTPRRHLREETAKSMPPAGPAVPWTKTPALLPDQLNVAPIEPGTPQAETEVTQAPQSSTKPVPEDIHRFIDEVVIREPGALCAFHYLFARYRKWRASFGLLATNLTQEQFAFAVQSHGIKTDLGRQLFFDARARREDPQNRLPPWKIL
jgi:hypothetical protein